MDKQNKEIIQYILDLLEILDGNGIVYTDEKFVKKILQNSSFASLKTICNRDLAKELQDIKNTSITWSVEDFLYKAQEINYRISKKKAEEALHRMIRKHDAELGINWDTVDYYVREYGTKIRTKQHKNK